MMNVFRAGALVLLVLALPAFAQSADQEVVSVVDSPDPVTPGATLSYTVTIRNNGPDPAVNGGLNINLPGGVTHTTDTVPAGWTCFWAGANGSCTTPSFAAGVTEVLTINVNVESYLATFADQNIAANFYPSGVTPDPNNANNAKGASTTVNSPQVDLLISSATDSPDPVFPDGNVTYNVSVSNAGPDSASTVNFNVVPHTSLQFQSVTVPAGWSCVTPAVGNYNATFTCSRATWAPGTDNFVIVFKADDAQFGINDSSFVSNFSLNAMASNETNNANNSSSVTTNYVTPDADINLSVSDSPDPVFPDGNITYTVTVGNAGPDAAPSVNLSSFGANNLRFVSATVPVGWNCTLPSAGTQTTSLSCTHAGSFASGASSVLTFVMQADDALLGVNDGTVQFGFSASSPISDPVNGNNSETESTAYTTPDADINVAVTDSPDPVNPDGNITYTVTVGNAGPDAAPSVNLSSFGANNLRFQSATVPAGWNCTLPSAGTQTTSLSCSHAASFANGASSVFTFVMQADDALLGINDGTVQFGFSATSPISDPVNSNNSETESTAYVTPDADISVAVSDSPDPVNPDGNITYTVTVANAGPDAAPSVNLSSFGANNLRFVSATVPAGWNCTLPAAGTQTTSIPCTHAASFASGASSILTFVMQADDALLGTADTTIQFGFTANSPIADPVPANNSETELTAYDGTSADLTLGTTDVPDPAVAGGTVTYTHTVGNAGPDAATNVSFTQAVPTGTTFQSLSAPAGWSCTTPAVGATGTINCTIASFPSGGSGVFTIVVNTPSAGPVSSTATVTSATPDPNPGNGTTNNTTTVNAVTTSDLTVTKTTAATSAPIGSTFSYTITVTNNGPDAATNVVMTDTLPASLLFRSITEPTGFDCTTPAVGTTGTITCTALTLANGVSRQFTLVVEVAPGATGSISNTASVDGDQNDGNSGNSTATNGVVVAAPASASLTLTKSTGSTQAITGSTITYTINVSNAGPSSATNVVVTDDLPAGLQFLSVTPSQGTCNAMDPISCTLGTITSGGSATITIQATVTATSGTVANTAAVSSTEGSSDSDSTPPIPVSVAAEPANVPTLSEWALIAMALALAVAALKARL
jgi:uncharacterized repeat protein (TIGR01451 family)